jgi:hypothetical protein
MRSLINVRTEIGIALVRKFGIKDLYLFYTYIYSFCKNSLKEQNYKNNNCIRDCKYGIGVMNRQAI